MQRPAPRRVAEDDRDLRRVGAAGSSLATSAPIASASPRSPAERSRVSAVVGRRAAPATRRNRARGGTAAGCRCSLGSASVVPPSAMPISRAAARAGRARPASAARPSSKGKRHRHLGRRASASISSSWLRGQVVEAVEEDRPLAPGLARVAQQRDRLAGDRRARRRGRVRSRTARVAGEQGGQVAEVGGALQRPGAGLDVGGVQPGPLQLVEQALEARRRSPVAAAERRSGPRSRRRSATATATPAGAGPRSASAPAARRRPSPRRERGRRRSSPTRRARAPLRAELALEAEDVVDGGHDEHRLALERVAEARAGRARRGPSWGVRGSGSAASALQLGRLAARSDALADAANAGLSGPALPSSRPL